MQIIIEHLHSSENDTHWAYSEQVESELCNNFILPTRQIEKVSEGYAPEWDVLLDNGKTIEIKVQSRNELCIEYKQKNHYNKWVASGISLSTADFWLFVNPGWGKKLTGKMEEVGKVRLLKRSDIIKQCFESTHIEHANYCEFRIPLSKQSPIAHEWLGDTKIIKDNNKILGFNLNQIYKPIYTKYNKYLL